MNPFISMKGFFVFIRYENVFVNSRKKTIIIYNLYILLNLIQKQTNYEQLPSKKYKPIV
jgi:hypothetical protein